MELFNYGEGQLSVEEQTYEAIRDCVEFSYDEFINLNDNERCEWIDACRLAILLIEEKFDLLYAGYSNTEMFDLDGKFNLGKATCIIKDKKRLLDMIENSSDIDYIPAQFILLGDKTTKKIANDVLKSINKELALELFIETNGGIL